MKLIGVLLIIAGIAAGLYCGLWWAFIGGIVAVIEEIRAESLSALNVALGICRILFAGAIGWIAACALIIPGAVMTRE